MTDDTRTSRQRSSSRGGVKEGDKHAATIAKHAPVGLSPWRGTTAARVTEQQERGAVRLADTHGWRRQGPAPASSIAAVVLLDGVMLLLSLRGMTPSWLVAGAVSALVGSVVCTVAIYVSRVVRAWEGRAS